MERQPGRAPRGAGAAVDAGGAQLGGDADRARRRRRRSGNGLRDHTDEFFGAADEPSRTRTRALWRLSLPQTAPPLGLAGDELIEWHGAQRWLRHARCRRRRCATPPPRPAATRRSSAARDKSAGVFAPLAPPLRAIHERLKHAFDPNGILNPRPPLPGL